MAPDPTTKSTGPPPLPPAVRQRLEQLFAHAKKSYEKNDTEYAHDLFTQCVAGDPANLTYLQHFRANIVKDTGGGPKKSGSFAAILSNSARGAIEKAASRAKIEEAFTLGCNALKKNPGDIGALQALAEASRNLHAGDCALFYLRWAMDVAPTDAGINRQAAQLLESIDEYDQAIACWRRVQQQKPDDQEAAKAISRLSVEAAIHRGGYESKPSGSEVDGEAKTPRVGSLAAKNSDGSPRVAEPQQKAPQDSEESLLAKIAENPAAPGPYAKLAHMYADAGRLKEAERLYTKALSASGGDPEIRSQLESLTLRRVHQEVLQAQQLQAEQPSAENQERVKRLVEQANRAELKVFAARAKRSPSDPRLHFEVGLRHKRLGEYREAIQAFQAARSDKQRAAEIQILLGECFQHIEQYKLALSSYEAAVAASDGATAADAETSHKLALYRVGVLAMGLKDYDLAEKRLTELAGLDFGYRDVADRLDKIAVMRKNG